MRCPAAIVEAVKREICKRHSLLGMTLLPVFPSFCLRKRQLRSGLQRAVFQFLCDSEMLLGSGVWLESVK